MAASTKSLLSMVGALGLVLCMLLMSGMPTGSAETSPCCRMRHMKLVVFFHDTLNKTDVLVATNMSAGATVTPTAASFGSIFVLTDPLTAAQDPSSAIVGSISSLATAVSFDGYTFFMIATLVFNTTAPPPNTPANLQGLNGTINLIGLINGVAPTPPLSVVGGAGTFALAQGTATFLALDVRTFVQLFSLEIDVYVPY